MLRLQLCSWLTGRQHRRTCVHGIKRHPHRDVDWVAAVLDPVRVSVPGEGAAAAWRLSNELQAALHTQATLGLSLSTTC